MPVPRRLAVLVTLILASTALAIVTAATPGHGGAVRRARDQPDRVRELPAGQPGERVGHHRRRRPEHPGLRDRHQRQPGQHGRASRSTPTRRRYRLDIYRMGYYGGDGRAQGRDRRRRRVAAADQPACLTDATHGPRRLRQLGRVGVLDRARRRRLGHLHRPGWCATDGRAARATSSSSSATTTARSDLLFQTSDTTWQAYNNYGGNSLYTGVAAPAAPTRSATTGRSTTRARRRPRTGSSTPSTRWSAGSRPTATTSATSRGVDTDRRGAELLEHKVFLSVGHDEYWSGGRSGPTSRRRATRGVAPGVLQRQRGLLEDALGEQHRRLGHAVPHAGLLQGDARQRQDRSARPTPGPAPGATRASARRPTAAGRRTR